MVTPAPPTAGKNVKICAAAVSAAVADLASRAQARTSSIGGTGLTNTSATRICMKRRASALSKLWVTATTGGWLPICFIIIASASNSASSPSSTSMMRMVAPAQSLLLLAEGFDLTMLSPICPELLNVAQTDSSNAGSAVRTIIRSAWVMDRPLRIRL